MAAAGPGPTAARCVLETGTGGGGRQTQLEGDAGTIHIEAGSLAGDLLLVQSAGPVLAGRQRGAAGRGGLGGHLLPRAGPLPAPRPLGQLACRGDGGASSVE